MAYLKQLLIALFVGLLALNQAECAKLSSDTSVLRALRRELLRTRCRVDICFAVDGSSSISSADFQTEKDFVTTIADVVKNTGSAFALAQYSDDASLIQTLTPNAKTFASAVSDMGQFFGGTNIAAGLNACVKHLSCIDDKDGKVIVLGDGYATVGDAKLSADFFRSVGGSVCAVGTENSNQTTLQDIAGTPENVFSIENFSSVSELQNIIDDLIRQTCA